MNRHGPANNDHGMAVRLAFKVVGRFTSLTTGFI